MVDWKNDGPRKPTPPKRGASMLPVCDAYCYSLIGDGQFSIDSMFYASAK